MEWYIDPRNPGEIFACAGLAHLAWRANPESKTGFDLNDRVRFVAPELSPMLDSLAAASLEETEDGLRFADIELDWWREWGLNSGLKNWAGQQSALTVHRSLRAAAEGSRASGWLAHAAPATGRLNFDTMGTWNALNMGWSLNEHTEAVMLSRPWVELLASIGLQAFPGRRGEIEKRVQVQSVAPGFVTECGCRVRRPRSGRLLDKPIPFAHRQVGEQYHAVPCYPGLRTSRCQHTE